MFALTATIMGSRGHAFFLVQRRLHELLDIVFRRRLIGADATPDLTERFAE